MDVVLTCPLGSECEEIRDNKSYRCRWFVEMKGNDASGEEHNRWDCAIAWQPILQVEQSQSSREVSSAIISLRNETTKRQDFALQEVRGALDGTAVITG